MFISPSTLTSQQQNVAKCAWLGELDSAEESDELSSEFDFQREILGQNNRPEQDIFEDLDNDNEDDISENTDETTVLSINSDEMPRYASIVEKWSLQSRKILIKRLMDQIIVNRNESSDSFLKNVLAQTDVEPPKVSNLRVEDIDDGSEDLTDDEDALVDHFLNEGKFNQKNTKNNKADNSNEETRSSWSSSEEALASCEGAIFNIPLDGSTKCQENATFDEMSPVMNNLSHVADSTGTSTMQIF